MAFTSMAAPLVPAAPLPRENLRPPCAQNAPTCRAYCIHTTRPGRPPATLGLAYGRCTEGAAAVPTPYNTLAPFIPSSGARNAACGWCSQDVHPRCGVVFPSSTPEPPTVLPVGASSAVDNLTARSQLMPPGAQGTRTSDRPPLVAP
jgi:hypothetical protein